jgi:hypothetical protein
MRVVWSLISRAKCCAARRHRALVGKMLEEAADHGQRRAQFVRDVGDEGAAHRLDAPGIGDVEADQQLVAARREGPPGWRRRASRKPATAGERRLSGPDCQVLGETWRAHQLLDDRAAIARQANSQMRAGGAIAPLDLMAGVKDHQAIGDGVHGVAERAQARLDPRGCARRDAACARA